MINLKELGFLGLYTLAMLMITHSPYFVGHVKPFPGYTFNGYLVFEEDMNSYLSYIRQSANGKWLFQNQFTPEDHTGLLLNLEWLAFGKISSALKTSLTATFQIQRIVGAIALIVGFYLFSSVFLESRFVRGFALLVFSLGGGFGWVYALSRNTHIFEIPFVPLDLTGGLHPFFQIMLNPHFSIAQGTLLLTSSLYLMGEKKGDIRYHLFAGILCGVLGLMRPYDMVVFIFTIFIFMVLHYVGKRECSLHQIVCRSLTLLIALPVMLYNAYIFGWHPVYKWWYTQSVMPEVSPLVVVFSIGLIFFFVLNNIAGFSNLREKGPHNIFLIAFIASVCILSFSSPIVKFAAQFGTASMGPLVILGLTRLERPLLAALVKKRYLLVVFAFVIVNSLTSLWLVKTKIDDVSRGAHHTDNRLIAAFSWLEENSRPLDTVFASCESGNKIPRYSGNKVFCGYAGSTVEFNRKAMSVKKFFSSGTSQEERREVLRRYKVKYVLYGPTESALGQYKPEASSFLRLVYRNEIVSIFSIDENV